MARVLFLHGSSSGPHSGKAAWLESHGHLVVGRPSLPYPRRLPAVWTWLWNSEGRRWFGRALEAAQDAYDRCRPEVVVGSSLGGAVAMNLRSGVTPQVLVAPAWRVKGLLRFGRARTVKLATVILHGSGDTLVLLRDSRRLLRDSPQPGPGEADLVAALDRQLRDKLAREGGGSYVIEGRLVTIRGEDHRCNSPAALRALLAAVEVLAGVAEIAPSGSGPAEGPGL